MASTMKTLLLNPPGTTRLAQPARLGVSDSDDGTPTSEFAKTSEKLWENDLDRGGVTCDRNCLRFC